VIPSLLWLIARLARIHDVVVYVLRYHRTPRSYSLLGATICDLGSPDGVRRQYLALIRALRRDGPFDVLHGWWALPSGLVASVAGWRLSVPTIVTCDSGEFVAIPEIGYGSQLQWHRRLAVAATVRLATRVTVCSRYQAGLANPHGVRPEVIPIGVDCSQFRPAERAEGPPWRLLQVASLNPVKDQPTLLAAFREVIEQGIDAHLDVIGEDTLNGSIQNLASRLGLESHVTFHGVLPSDRLVPFYQHAHLLVVSSRHEAAGVVALEASACALPAAGTAVGYLADWSPQGAAIVQPGNGPALATRILELLRDRAERERLGRWAREWTLAHDADWTARQFDGIYRSLATTIRR
jgi:glycosyltransferase involved in cell wall biosynthesis